MGEAVQVHNNNIIKRRASCVAISSTDQLSEHEMMMMMMEMSGEQFSLSDNNFVKTDSFSEQKNGYVSDRRSQQDIICYIKSAYPEKRQSDPHICYSFYNQSFDLPIGERRRFHSQWDVSRKMPNIVEYCFEEPVNWPQLMRPKYESGTTTSTTETAAAEDGATISAGGSFMSNSSSAKTIPKIKVRISDDRGRRINSIGSPDSDLFDDVLTESELGDNRAVDAYVVTGTESTDCFRCKKCGHPRLPMQFSTTFDGQCG